MNLKKLAEQLSIFILLTVVLVLCFGHMGTVGSLIAWWFILALCYIQIYCAKKWEINADNVLTVFDLMSTGALTYAAVIETLKIIGAP